MNPQRGVRVHLHGRCGPQDELCLPCQRSPGEGRWPRGPISRILCPDGSRGGGHLSSPPVAGRIVRPTRGRGRAPLPREADVPLFGLAPGGVCQHPVSPPGLVRSYRTLSPLPAPDRDRGRRRSALCGTFRRLTTPGRYPAPRPRESGLSSPIRSGRPPGPLGRPHHTAPKTTQPGPRCETVGAPQPLRPSPHPPSSPGRGRSSQRRGAPPGPRQRGAAPLHSP